MTTEHELGPFVDSYVTDNARRARRVAAGLVLGLVITAIGVALALPAYLSDSSEGPNLLIPSLVTGLGAAFLVVSAVVLVQLAKYRGEVFELYEGGLVQRYRGGTRVFRWAEMTKVTDNSRGNLISQLLGGEVNIHIKLADGGGPVRITDFTADAWHLALVVKDRFGERG